MNKRSAGFVPVNIFFVLPLRLLLLKPGNDLDSLFAQKGKPFSGDKWIWVFNRADDTPFDSRF
jgi:hypothetical protein